jgi:hypothetical protein
MCAGTKMGGVPVEADQFGEAQTGLDRDQQQGVISAAEPRRLIGRGEDCLNSISGRVRKCTCRLSWRLFGMASTRWISALCAGSSNDTNRKKERIAVKRRLRVLALAPRFVSRSIKNAPMNCAHPGR